MISTARSVWVHGHTQHAPDRQLLVDHVIHRQFPRRAHALAPGHHHPAPAHGDADGVVQRLRRVGRRVDHDLRTAPGQLAHPGHDVLGLGIDCRVRTELARQAELLRVAAESGDDDLRGAGGERIEHHGTPGGDRRVHLFEHGVGREVHALGVTTPEVGWSAHVGVAIGATALGAGARLPARAGLAAPAPVTRSHGHSVALLHLPALPSASADFLDARERLMPRDDGVGRVVLVLWLSAISP